MKPRFWSLCLLLPVCFAVAGTGQDKPQRQAPTEAERYWRERVFGENGERQAEEELVTSTITMQRANRLFYTFAKNTSIPYRYPVDGCYARATEMARIAEAQGISMAKVFTTGRLQVRTDNSKYPLVQWGWHVAPVVKVRQDDGREVAMVFDPSLFDRPVTVTEWNQRMLTQVPESEGGYTPEIALTFFARRYQHFPGLSPERTWSASTLQNTTETFRRYQSLQDRVLEPPPYRPLRQTSPGAR